MPLSPTAICSRALLKLGARPIQSFLDASVEADLSLSFFEPVRDALLSAYPWRFAVTQTELARLSDAPVSDYAHAFQLPVDCLRVLSVGTGGRSKGLQYRRVGNTVRSNSDTMVIDYVFRPEEDSFPGYFEQVLIARLAAEFCLPLTENTSRAEMLYRLADNEFERAKRIDAQQDSPRALHDFNLLNARES